MNFKAKKDKSIQRFRISIQLLFMVLCIWIGIAFSLFVSYLASNGVSAFYQRPSGVEGFLPISSLMSVLFFFKTGEIHSFHPAGFFIFIGIIGIAMLTVHWHNHISKETYLHYYNMRETFHHH